MAGSNSETIVRELLDLAEAIETDPGLTARLPSLLGVILALWSTAGLARLWRGPPAGWRAAGYF